MPEYLIEGEFSEITKLPCDDLAKMTGIIHGNTFKKVSKFKTEYFQKARETLQKTSLNSQTINNENQNPNIKSALKKMTETFKGTKTDSTNNPESSLFNWSPVNKQNGLPSSLCNEQNPPKFGLHKLKNFLKKYGVFPDDMRLAIWGYLLNIPLKKHAYDQLKFLGEFKPNALNTFQSEASSQSESLKSEIVKWKSKWNLTSG